MYTKQLLLSLFTIFALLFAGCSDESNPSDSGNSGGGDFTVTVGSGTSPQYSWSSGNAFSVSVVCTAAPTVIVWGIATPGQGNIASPAKHGVTPAGALPSALTETVLSAGTEYRVSVSLLDGKTGYTDFTP